MAALVDDAVALAHRWLGAPDDDVPRRERVAAERLAALVGDPAGLDLAVRFVDRVARPRDVRVAARELAALRTAVGHASFLGAADRALLTGGSFAARVAPGVVVPAARARLHALVGHLVVDDGPALGRHLAAARAEGFVVNLNLLGEAVLGEAEAGRRLDRIRGLVARPDVEHVSVKVSAVASNLTPWDVDGGADRVAQRLLPLLDEAAGTGTAVTLDMEEHRDVDLTLGVLERLADEPAGRQAELGVALQAYLPRTPSDLERVVAAARRRADAGGARLAVRLVKGANLAMEHVDAELHSRRPPTFATKPDVDVAYVRLLATALDPAVADALVVGVASHNLFHVALAVLLARARGVERAVRVEMLQGMAPAAARALRDDVGRVLLYTPVAARQDLDAAVAYLVRRLEEAAAPQNFLHALAAPDALAGQEAAFRAAVSAAADDERATDERRAEERATDERGDDDATPGSVAGAVGFPHAPDTDLAVAADRHLLRSAVRAWTVPDGSSGAGGASGRPAAPPRPDPDHAVVVVDTRGVDAAVARVAAAGRTWGALDAATRAGILRRAAEELAHRRAELVGVMVAEAGKTVAEADPEVSEAVDFARYYADRALELDSVRGATHAPGPGITLVTPPWNFPISIPVGAALAALAAGTGVLVKPAPQTPRCARVAFAAVHAALDAAGAPLDALLVAECPEGDVGRHLATHDGVARVLLTGSIDTARLFATWRPDRDVLAETSGKNAIVVTPSADVDLAVADVVRSAFGHAGQKCSAASLLVLVGSAGFDDRLRRQLADAVTSLPVGPAEDPRTVVGPLIDAPHGDLLRALTTLDPGEEWLVQPRRLADRLWTPGVRHGVVAGSWFHRTECFGPVLGVVRVATLDEAIAVQNAVPFGLTGGLHSLDEHEIERWLGAVEVGNAYVNRTITGAVVARQPFGGWKQSVVGPGAKAGGPHYVAQIGSWSDAPGVPQDDEAWLAWARDDDARTWASMSQPLSLGLAVESDELRLRPLPHLTLRVGDDAPPRAVARVRHAARTVGVPVTVTTVDDESHEGFAARVRAGAVAGRVRVVGAAPGLREAAAPRAGTVTVLDGPVLASAGRELLTMVREQAVSRTLHRWGHVPAARAD
ncbi:proline dehydrogenase family protein [Cellulomonas alba]|uniref:L-glutamate gamma-semialdehyde dehydrogenase n=1 Tax=Cellulomonas alba TaxID=3053467 RepID=A0ABT7SD06_9CELL|nr:proline dehydrogenase family protein [Cellulomonas alba]MDM7854067.1 proline dehydrogenase family protein [Cellulomonas alba]